MKKIKILFLIVVVICIPFLFNIIFHDDKSSHLWFIESTISVSDWFNFWISYISTIVASFLAFEAIRLSRTIEFVHQNEQAEKNKVLFKIENANFDVRIGSPYKIFDIDIELPYEVQCLKNFEVVNAMVLFNDGNIMKLNPQKAAIIGNSFKLYPLTDDIAASCKRILAWKLWYQNMMPDYKIIVIDITYRYDLDGFYYKQGKRKTICITDVKCKVMINRDDPAKTKTVGMIANITDIKI